MQIIDLRDTDKSRYFAIAEFNNCFIIRSPSLFFSLIFIHKRSLAKLHCRGREPNNYSPQNNFAPERNYT